MCEFGWTGPLGLEHADEHRCGPLPTIMLIGQCSSALMFPVALIALRDNYAEWAACRARERKNGTRTVGMSAQYLRLCLALLMVLGLPGVFLCFRLGLQAKYSMATLQGKLTLAIITYTVSTYYLAIGLVMVLMHRVLVVTAFTQVKPDPSFEKRAILLFVAPLVVALLVVLALCCAHVLEDNVTVLRVSLGVSALSMVALVWVTSLYGKRVLAAIDEGMDACDAVDTVARAKLQEAKRRFQHTTRYLVMVTWVGVLVFALVFATPLLESPSAFVAVQTYIYQANVIITTGVILRFIKRAPSTPRSTVRPTNPTDNHCGSSTSIQEGAS